MGSPPKPLLVIVILALLACGAGGFALGFVQTQPRKAAAADEEAPIAAHIAPGAVIKDAEPLAEPPPPPPKAKAADDDEPDSDTPAEIAPKAPPPLVLPPPSEAAPGAPPGLPPPPPSAPPRLPDDLPPT